MKIDINLVKSFFILLSKIVLTILLLAAMIYFWPFTFAIITAILIEPVVRWIIEKIKIKRKVAGIIVVFIIYLFIISSCSLLVYKLVTELAELSSRLPEIYDKVSYYMDKIYLEISQILNKFPEEVTVKIYEVGRNFLEKFIRLLYNIFDKGMNMIGFIPNLLVYLVVNVLATVFLVIDRNKISSFLKEKMPSTYINKLFLFIKDSSKTLIEFLKAQGILLIITFFELLIAFVFIKQPYPIVFALIIALVDALPILGTGTVLIPWSIMLSFTGKINISLFLIGTYITILVVRQLIEPKIVSKAIGVHPLVTLVCMYICFKFFGLVGLFIGSILAVILKTILFERFHISILWNSYFINFFYFYYGHFIIVIFAFCYFTIYIYPLIIFEILIVFK